MTQHGSFPGRPRGRRARPYNDVPGWAGFDAVPEDQREFPDLAPIRGRDARARDGRVQEEQGTGGNGHLPDGHPSDGQPPDSRGHASAEPDGAEAFSERWRRRGSASRGDRRADRRRRRRLLAAGGGPAGLDDVHGSGGSESPDDSEAWDDLDGDSPRTVRISGVGERWHDIKLPPADLADRL